MGGGGVPCLRMGWSRGGQRSDPHVTEHHPQGVGGADGAGEQSPGALDSRLRKEGGGRKRCSEADPGLVETLEWLVEPLTRGDPSSPLRWTCKSTTNPGRGIKSHGASCQSSDGRPAAERGWL